MAFSERSRRSSPGRCRCHLLRIRRRFKAAAEDFERSSTWDSFDQRVQAGPPSRPAGSTPHERARIRLGLDDVADGLDRLHQLVELVPLIDRARVVRGPSVPRRKARVQRVIGRPAPAYKVGPAACHREERILDAELAAFLISRGPSSVAKLWIHENSSSANMAGSVV